MEVCGVSGEAGDQADRDARILALREEGLTLRAIAREVDLSAQMVNVILRQHGVTDPSVARNAKRSKRAAQEVEDASRFESDHGVVVGRLLAANVPPPEIVARLGALGHDVTEGDVRDFADRSGLPVPKPVPPRFGRVMVQLAVLAAAAETAGLSPDPGDGAILESGELLGLRDACPVPGELASAAALAAAGRAGSEGLSITKDRYDEWRGEWIRRYGKVDLSLPWPPTSQTVMKQTGKGAWNDAVREAGLTANTRGRTRGRIFYTGDDAYEEVAQAFVEDVTGQGRRPTVAEYRRWSRGRSAPSEAAMRTYFGPWGQLVRVGMARSGSTMLPRDAVRKAGRADRLVDDQLFELHRHIEHAGAGVDTTGTPAEAAFQLKESVADLAGEVVSGFEVFRRQWIVAATAEDPSAFVAALSSGGSADTKSKKIWATLDPAAPIDAIPKVIDDRDLDRLIGVPSGSVRDGGGWLAGGAQSRLVRLSEADVARFRVLKAARNVVEHESENAIRVLAAVVAALDPVADAVLLDGAGRLTSRDRVVRWLAAKPIGVEALAYGGTIAKTRLGALIATVERIVATMRSDYGTADT